MMGSELHLKSNLGKGSIFWFELGLSQIPWTTDGAKAEARNITGYKGERRKILIADDKDENRHFLKDVLLPIGFEIAEAADGRDALDNAMEFYPDLILMDLVMPVMDGFKATELIREIPALRDVIVISVSASVSEKVRKKSLMAGCDDYITKPVQIDDLLARLETCLELEWIYDKRDIAEDFPSVKTLGSLSSALPSPSAEELNEIYRLAMKGDIIGVRKRAEKLMTVPEFTLFGEKLYHLAEKLMIKEIRQFITRYTERERDECQKKQKNNHFGC